MSLPMARTPDIRLSKNEFIELQQYPKR